METQGSVDFRIRNREGSYEIRASHAELLERGLESLVVEKRNLNGRFRGERPGPAEPTSTAAESSAQYTDRRKRASYHSLATMPFTMP